MFSLRVSQTYYRLAAVKEAFGPNPNRHDRAVVMIGACILEGADTRQQIIRELRSQGLSKDFVAGILDDQTGDIPGLHLWRLHPDGRYEMHAES